MSYDDNNIKSRKSHIYFDAIYRDNRGKRKNTNRSNHPKFSSKQSKSNNKTENTIFIQRRKQKQLTLGPLSSTLESTISTSKRQIEEEKSPLSSEKITIKSKKLVQPADEDMKFLFDLFFKNNQNFSSNKYNNILRTSNRTNYNNRNNTETIDSYRNYYNYNNKYDFPSIKKYLIKIQKKFNLNGHILLYTKHFEKKNKSSGDFMNSYYLQKLQDLIARYSIIIFIFIKCGKITEAKEIFLVMLKENMNTINNLEEKISEKYLYINRNINLYKDAPKVTYELAKIYSFIIKYSQIFNLMNYHNIFIGKYFQLQVLNFNFFMIKANVRGFSTETRNQIKYWLCYCIHNCSYYSINYFFPLKVPIILNYNISNLYNNCDETYLTDSEKSLLIKTSYNEGILYYLNGQKDESLLSLNNAKEKIISFSDDYYANLSYNIKNNKKRNFVNLFTKQVKENIKEINEKTKLKKKSTINPFKLKFVEDISRNNDKKKTLNIQSNKSVNLKNNNNLGNILFNSFENNERKKSKELTNQPKNREEELKASIFKGFKKDKITISDIELLVQYGKEKGYLNEEPTSGEKGLDFLFKYKESFSAIKKKITLPKGFRGSHIDFQTSIKIKDFSVPEKFKNPLLRKIELLMSIIELDKKNYEAAYEHVLKVLYIMFLLKLSTHNYHNNFFYKQKMEINEYFQLIETTYENDMKYKQFLEKSSSKSIITINDRKSQSNINNFNFNNISNLNNNSFIIFENKEAEKNFKLNYNNNDKNDDCKQNNYCNYNNRNKDSKIVKEFEKFFIFLNNLSMFQIKILNETQPDDEKRNHLPIMLSNQFKDCLTRDQRIDLDNLEIMTLSRFMVLKDPNKWIIPTNLNYLLIERSRNPPINKRSTFHLNFERYNFIDDTFMKTKEYKNYLDIINSEKSTPEIKEFLKNNKNYVFKIIKESNEIEINNIIKYPYIIIDPIKKYKRKIKKYKKSIITLNDKQKRPKTITPGFARKKFQNNNLYNNKQKLNNLNKKRKKNSTVDNFHMKCSVNIKKNNNKYKMNAAENNIFIKESNKKINYNEESNESYEDYLLSPESSTFRDDNNI